MQKCKLTVLISTLIFITIGCKKQKLNNEHNEQNSLSSLRIADNFDFNQFGISHNNFLIWMDGHDATSWSDSAQHALSLSYADSFFGDYEYNPSLMDFQITLDSVNIWSDRVIENNMNNQILADQNFVSDSMVLFLNKLSELFYYAGSNDFNPTQFMSSIDSLEDWVTANFSIQIDQSNNYCNDGAAMLAMSSIAMHSYEYWYAKYDDGSEGRGILGRIWRAIKIAACDTYGFLNDGWIDTDGNGRNDTWHGPTAVAGAGERSYNAGN